MPVCAILVQYFYEIWAFDARIAIQTTIFLAQFQFFGPQLKVQ